MAITIGSGCGGSNDATTPAETTTVGPAHSTTTVTALPDELSPEDDLRQNPPPPANVHATSVTRSAVSLAWDPPPAVTVPHGYSDRVVNYRVYRRGPGENDFGPLATVLARAYVDRSVTGSQSYEYSVTSIRAGDLEGTKSAPVTVTTPY